jgi:hypothetical protein
VSEKSADEMAKTDAETTLLGVVYPPGAGASRSPGNPWTVRFQLQPWRQVGGVLHESNLSISKPVADDELQNFTHVLRPYQIIQVRVRFVDKDLPRAELIELEELNVTDAELLEHAERLQQPVTISDPTFGTLTFNRDVDWWEANVAWLNQPIQLFLSVEEPADLESVLASARILWQNQAQWSQRVQDFAIDKLLELKNDSWLEEDEEPLTASQFVERMTLESITIYPDGGFDFLHNDGDLFWGHSIQVTGTLREGPTDADIPG